MDQSARSRLVIVRVAEMVLDVAVALDVGGQEASLEFREDHLVRLGHDVGEHVETTAVGGAHHDLFDASFAALGDDGVEQGDQRLGALERETLLADVLGVEKLFEAGRRRQLLEDVLAIVSAELGPVEGGLHVLLEPVPLDLVGDVHVLDAEGAAVGGAQEPNQLAQRGVRTAAEAGTLDGALEVVFVEAELAQRQQGMIGLVVAERVEVGDQVAELPVGVDEVEDAERALGPGACGVTVGGELEAGEELRPVFSDRAGVAAKLPVQLLDVIGVRPKDQIQVHSVPSVGHRASIATLAPQSSRGESRGAAAKEGRAQGYVEL